MVKTLGRALRTWHLVEWFHQNIGSDRVVLFRRKDMYDIDYHKPYILVTLSSLAPMLFIQFLDDDTYSFGVLLLDIGLWQLASDALSKGQSITRLSPVGIRDKLLKNSRRRLSHYIGTFYAHAVDKCVSRDPKFDLEAQY